MKQDSKSPRMGLVLFGLLVFSMFVFVLPSPQVSAQTQYVTTSPGNINLGMNTTIAVTGPAAGSYILAVQKPSGVVLQLNETFTSAGQVQNSVFGLSGSGFKSLVDQVGTYNVFLEQGTTIVSSSSFYATNKLIVSMDMIGGTTCAYVPSGLRGMEMFPRFYVTFASNGGPVTNTDKGVVVTYTLPDSTKANATWHAPNPTESQSLVGFFIGRFLPAWNYTHVGPWVPIVKATDGAGNTVTWTYIGMPFTVSTVALKTNIILLDSVTNQTMTAFQNGGSANILANVTYPAPPGGSAAVPGFVGPLDSATKHGSVYALVGWGYYNATSGAFGGKNPGGLISQVTMTYNTKTHLWAGNVTSLPTISGGNTYKVIVVAQDGASPPNTGSSLLSVPIGAQTATGSQSITQTTTQSVTQSVTQTTTQSVTQSVTQTTTKTTTQSSATSQSSSNGVEGLPVWAYAATTITLIIGVIVGFIARRK